MSAQVMPEKTAEAMDIFHAKMAEWRLEDIAPFLVGIAVSRRDLNALLMKYCPMLPPGIKLAKEMWEHLHTSGKTNNGIVNKKMRAQFLETILAPIIVKLNSQVLLEAKRLMKKKLPSMVETTRLNPQAYMVHHFTDCLNAKRPLVELVDTASKGILIYKVQIGDGTYLRATCKGLENSTLDEGQSCTVAISVYETKDARKAFISVNFFKVLLTRETATEIYNAMSGQETLKTFMPPNPSTVRKYMTAVRLALQKGILPKPNDFSFCINYLFEADFLLSTINTTGKMQRRLIKVPKRFKTIVTKFFTENKIPVILN
jgi:hypothetical protein